MLIANRRSRRAPDLAHPFGYGPEAYVWSLFAAVGLFVAGAERGHRTLTVLRKGGKLVTIPLAPRTARAIDLAIGERLDGRSSGARTGSGWIGTAPGGSSAGSPDAPG